MARAMDIADAEGLDAITIRRISKEFGVTPMALYWHVQNKVELLEAMGDALYAGIAAEVDPDASWQDQLRVLMSRLVEALRRHPGSVPLAYVRVLMSEPGLRLSETVFALLTGAGFGDEVAAMLGSAALRTAVSLVADEPGLAFGSEQERAAAIAAKHAHIATLPNGEFPTVQRLAAMLLDCDGDEYYALGIDHYVAGVAHLAAARQSAHA